MKNHLFFNAALTILGLAMVPLKGQGQTSSYIETSKIVGTRVQTSQGEEVGEIRDVVLDSTNGCVAYTVVATGGTGAQATGGPKAVVVPWAVYSISPGARVYQVRVEREKIYSAPVFEASRIQEYSSQQWIDQVYSHYGVSASAGVGVGATQRSPGLAPSPPAASESPAGRPARAESPSTPRTPAETASPTQTRSPRARISPSPEREAGREASPTGREKPSVTPSSRHHREITPGETREESTPATTEGLSGKEKKSSYRQKGKEQQSTVEPGTTPEPED
jgi:sporulation protein YlmC with PRC-barrel domain